MKEARIIRYADNARSPGVDDSLCGRIYTAVILANAGIHRQFASDARATRHPSMMTRQRWDIFCKVIDNFGDAAVAWRLARELANEHSIEVTLWIDRVDALARLVPRLRAAENTQSADNLIVRRWTEPFPQLEPAEVVIEAFGCGVP